MQANAVHRPARRAWLVLIALGHLAVLMAWRPMPRSADETAVRPEGQLVFLTLPPAASHRPVEAAPDPAPAALPARVRPAPPPVASAVVRPEAPPAASEAAQESITLPTPAAGDPADLFAKPAAPAETLLEKNRELAAGVDRQLRKESLNKFATIVREDSPLARQLARAYNGQVVLEQVSDLGDGRTMKRFRAGGKEWCEVVNLVGAAGQDPFRDGNKVQVKTCP